jgi:phage terminase large subunit-like protein
LLDEGFPMEVIHQSPERMVPICSNAYELIASGRVVHDPGDVTLTAHVNAAVRRTTDRGWTLTKSRSRHKIDACIALALALWGASAPGKPKSNALKYFRLLAGQCMACGNQLAPNTDTCAVCNSPADPI